MLVASAHVVVQGAILLLANMNIIIPNEHHILTKINTISYVFNR